MRLRTESIKCFCASFIECIQAPAEMKRRFFFCEVPVRYYPVALYALFSFLGGGPSIAHAISMGVGYLFGQGHLNSILKLSQSKTNEWEHGVLANFSSRPGWVYGHAALGSDAWTQIPTNEMGMMVSWGCWACIWLKSSHCESIRLIPPPTLPSFLKGVPASTRSSIHRGERKW